MQAKLLRRCAAAAIGCAFLATSLCALADEPVRVRNDPRDIAAAIFPSDRYTVRDGSQITLRRVKLPKPDCTVRPSDCADIDVVNTLDGFSTQPRITVPFTGDIDPDTVDS